MTTRRAGAWSAICGLVLLLVAACSPTAVDDETGTRLTCGSGPRFDPGDLAKPPSEPSTDEPGVALETFLASQEAAFARLPPRGWTRVAASADAILFLAPSTIPDAPFAMIVLGRDPAGWSASTWGGCLPRSDAGVAGPAGWDLEAALDREADTIAVLVSEIACASGHMADDRILPPKIDYEDERVTITFWVAPYQTNEGAITCPAPPPSRYVISLPEPIGDRELLDGGVFPPRTVAESLRDPG